MNEEFRSKLNTFWEQTKVFFVRLFIRFLTLVGIIITFFQIKYGQFLISPRGRKFESDVMEFRRKLGPKFLMFGSYVQKYTLIALAFLREQYGRFITTPAGKRVQETVVIVWSVIVRLFVNLKSCLPAGMAYIVNLHLLTPPLTKEKKFVWAVIGGIGIVVFVLLNIYTFRYGSQLARRWEAERIARLPPPPIPTPTPTPIPFAHKGKMKFTINSGGGDGPNMTKCAIDPLDFSSSPKQTFTVDVEHGIPVTSVTAVWVSDNKQKDVALKLATGSATRGTWEGSWSVDDTAWYHYQIGVRATDGKNTSNVMVTLR